MTWLPIMPVNREQENQNMSELIVGRLGKPLAYKYGFL